ncbi:MAG: hypothetical protein KJ645_09095, partial [Planctomycetes bacterium]|nr:hypothetical protein [Planctomycetota bacterium]
VLNFGGGLERMKAIVEAAKKNEAFLAGDIGIRNVKIHLPANRANEIFFALDHTMTLVRNITTVLEEDEIPIDLGELNAPMGIATGGNENQVVVDLFFPTALMKAIKDTTMTLMGSGMEEDPGYEDF